MNALRLVSLIALSLFLPPKAFAFGYYVSKHCEAKEAASPLRSFEYTEGAARDLAHEVTLRSQNGKEVRVKNESFVYEGIQG